MSACSHEHAAITNGPGPAHCGARDTEKLAVSPACHARECSQGWGPQGIAEDSYGLALQMKSPNPRTSPGIVLPDGHSRFSAPYSTNQIRGSPAGTTSEACLPDSPGGHAVVCNRLPARVWPVPNASTPITHPSFRPGFAAPVRRRIGVCQPARWPTMFSIAKVIRARVVGSLLRALICFSISPPNR